MRDRVVEFLPLLLVVLLLATYQFMRTRTGDEAFAFVTPATTLAPTPTIAVAGARAIAAAPTATPLIGPGCTSGRPRFLGNLALLRAAMGAQMGDPLECEHGVDVQGNTEQKTSTGLAYYRKGRNAPCFTTGYDHWSLASDGSLIHWTGDAVDPPE